MKPISGSRVDALYTALEGIRTAQSQVAQAAGSVATGDPEKMLDGFVSLSAARLALQANAVVARTTEENDRYLIDIIA